MKRFIVLFMAILLIGGAFALFSNFRNSKNENVDVETPTMATMTIRNDDLCDYFAIGRNGESIKANGYSATSYIDVTGAESLTITMAQNDKGTTYGLAFYDKDKNFISFVNSPIGSYAVKEIDKRADASLVYRMQ